MERRVQRREGREPIIEAAADLFGLATLEEVAAFVGPRAVASASGKAAGTVTYHFPANRGRELREEALKRALGRTGAAEATLREELTVALAQVDTDGDAALAAVARALAHELGTFSPADGPEDPTVEAEETAAFLGAAVAPRDDVAARLMRGFTDPHVETHTWVAAELATKLGRRWEEGLSAERFGLVTNSLASGFLWTRRFDRDAAPLDLYADMYIRMFSASTASASSHPGDDYRLGLLPAAGRGGSSLDPGKRASIVAATHRLYDQGRWEAITVTAVAHEARVSRPTVIANLHNRNGLAAAVWTRHLPTLTAVLTRVSSQPLPQALTSYLLTLVTVARIDTAVTGAFLDGVFAYTVQHGAPNADDPVDPRNLVPLPLMLAPLIERSADQFRPGNADNRQEAIDTAALLVNHTLHLAMTRPHKDHQQVVNRIIETTLSGMLHRRPKSL